MDDEVRRGFHPSSGDPIRREVVAHDLDAERPSRLDRLADRRLVRAPHHDDEARARLRHHLGLEVPRIHRLQIGDDGVIGKPRAQRLHRAQAVREEERRARLEPVHAGIDGARRLDASSSDVRSSEI